MKLSVYVPDELNERLRAAGDMNVSAVCQAALEAELQRQHALSRLTHGMERIELKDENHGGADVAFEGSEIARARQGRHGREYIAYLTKGRRIAVYDLDAETLWTFDSFEDMTGWPESLGIPVSTDEAWDELVAAVAAQLEMPHVIELSI